MAYRPTGFHQLQRIVGNRVGAACAGTVIAANVAALGLRFSAVALSAALPQPVLTGGIVGNGLAVLLLDAPFANALLNGIVDQSLDDACQIAVSDCIPLTDVQQLGVRFSSVKNTLVLCFVSCYV